jgi:hypothetical protein
MVIGIAEPNPGSAPYSKGLSICHGSLSKAYSRAFKPNPNSILPVHPLIRMCENPKIEIEFGRRERHGDRHGERMPPPGPRPPGPG